MKARGLRIRFTSSLIGMIQSCGAYDGRPAFPLVRGCIVGLGGLEPAASSLSEIDSQAPSYPAFPLVARFRRCRRDGVNSDPVLSFIF